MDLELDLGEEDRVIGFDLLRPGLAWLLLAGVAVFLVGMLGLRARRSDLARLVEGPLASSFLPHLSWTRAWLRLLLAGAAMLLFAVSALGPVRGWTHRAAVARGVDLVVCIDTSRSMLARDLKPNRLERAKREVTGLLSRLSGDRVGLIAFAGDAREVAPLTHDRTTLAGLLAQVRPEDNHRGGTDLAVALEAALSVFDGRTGAHEAICLLTDGEDLEGRAAEVAEEAAERGIRVYVVGVGTEAGGKIPVVDRNGVESFVVGPDGEEVVTRLDGSTLSALAERTGGEYLSVESAATPLELLYERRISRLEGRDLEDGLRLIPNDRYQWSLGLALLCILAEVGLREGRGRKELAPR